MAISNEILRCAQDDTGRLQDDVVSLQDDTGRLLEGDFTHGNY